MPTCATKPREMLRLDLKKKKKDNYFLETLNYCSSATTEVKMRGKQEQVNKARKYQWGGHFKKFLNCKTV